MGFSDRFRWPFAPPTIRVRWRASLRDIVRSAAPGRGYRDGDALASRLGVSRRTAICDDRAGDVCGAAALTLASVGLCGVSLVRRFPAAAGARRAGGARGEPRRPDSPAVLRSGLAVTTIGLVLGMTAAAALTRLMLGALFGVTPLDPLSFVAAPLLLLPVALAACWLPASRARRRSIRPTR